MLEAQRLGVDLFMGLGTHDVRLIEQGADHAESVGLPRTAFDVEMLYGIRADQQAGWPNGAIGCACSSPVARLVSVVHAPAGRAAGQRRLALRQLLPF